jgi:hypothetical protein
LGLAVVGLGVAAVYSGDAAVTLPPLELDDMVGCGLVSAQNLCPWLAPRPEHLATRYEALVKLNPIMKTYVWLALPYSYSKSPK